MIYMHAPQSIWFCNAHTMLQIPAENGVLNIVQIDWKSRGSQRVETERLLFQSEPLCVFVGPEETAQ